MYEYKPNDKKTKEKIIFSCLLVLAAACFGVPHIPGIAFASIYQLLMIFCLVGAVMIMIRCLMRNYIYSVQPREGAVEGDLPDFVITEIYGNRSSVVCRISVGDLRRILKDTPQTHRSISAMQRRKQVYYYTARLKPENLYVLQAEENGEEIFLQICADEGLLQCLKTHAEQFLTN